MPRLPTRGSAVCSPSEWSDAAPARRSILPQRAPRAVLTGCSDMGGASYEEADGSYTMRGYLKHVFDMFDVRDDSAQQLEGLAKNPHLLRARSPKNCLPAE